MFAGIDSVQNIEVFLTPREIKIIKKGIEGVLIKLQDPQEQGRIFISIQGDRSSENSSGSIGVNTEDFFKNEVSLFLSKFAYESLVEYGRIETKHLIGKNKSKAGIYDILRLNEEEKLYAESLRYYLNKKHQVAR
ncbi:hypothetical protein DRN73_04075 [Candidatus Pacearchaeota archaeon]|nr:MAG: hypothetical protein DRN73_04075 [Candidatus Pacearchaeota archaeon]